MLLRPSIDYKVLMILPCNSDEDSNLSRIKSEAYYHYLQGKYCERKWQAISSYSSRTVNFLALSGKWIRGDLPRKRIVAGVTLRMKSRPSQEHAH